MSGRVRYRYVLPQGAGVCYTPVHLLAYTACYTVDLTTCVDDWTCSPSRYGPVTKSNTFLECTYLTIVNLWG